MKRSSLNDVCYEMVQIIAHKKGRKMCCVSIDNMRLICERQRASVQDEWFIRTQITVKRTLDLDEKRLEID